MSIQTEITRLQTARNKLRTKAVELGIGLSTDKLDTLASEYEGITNQGAVSASVQEGDTYTIPKGYHNGSGTVSGVKGGGNYNLQSKTVTPTKSQQNVTPDSGFYGLSDVTVNPIPDNFHDISSVTATKEDVLANKIFVEKDGSVSTGIMQNNGAVNKTLDSTTDFYTVPKGYHNGLGKVGIVLETKTATPNKQQQTIKPTTGKVISSVTVEAIPENYVDTSDANAIDSEILDTKIAYVNGVKVEGSMPNNGSVSGEIDGLTVTSKEIPAGYTSGGIISLDNSIEEALAGI